jgi:hypothetical protein
MSANRWHTAPKTSVAQTGPSSCSRPLGSEDKKDLTGLRTSGTKWLGSVGRRLLDMARYCEGTERTNTNASQLRRVSTAMIWEERDGTRSVIPARACLSASVENINQSDTYQREFYTPKGNAPSSPSTSGRITEISASQNSRTFLLSCVRSWITEADLFSKVSSVAVLSPGVSEGGIGVVALDEGEAAPVPVCKQYGLTTAGCTGVTKNVLFLRQWLPPRSPKVPVVAG